MHIVCVYHHFQKHRGLSSGCLVPLSITIPWYLSVQCCLQTALSCTLGQPYRVEQIDSSAKVCEDCVLCSKASYKMILVH